MLLTRRTGLVRILAVAAMTFAVASLRTEPAKTMGSCCYVGANCAGLSLCCSYLAFGAEPCNPNSCNGTPGCTDEVNYCYEPGVGSGCPS
jgi:hypothetical protein